MPSAGPYAGPELIALLNGEGIDVFVSTASSASIPTTG